MTSKVDETRPKVGSVRRLRTRSANKYLEREVQATGGLEDEEVVPNAKIISG